MIKVNKKDIVHVADLAKIELTASETKKFGKQLSEIVEYIGRLQEIPTSNIIPTAQTTGLENKTREDEFKKEDVLSSQEALSSTESTHNDYFVVPMVLTERSDY